MTNADDYSLLLSVPNIWRSLRTVMMFIFPTDQRLIAAYMAPLALNAG